MFLIALRPLLALTLVVPAPAREYTGVDTPEVAPEAVLVPEPGSAPEPAPAVEAAPGSASGAVPPAPGDTVGAALTALEGPLEEEEAELVPYDPMVDSPEAIRARHWVRSGIVFMVLGAGLSLGAIAMSRADVNDPETGDMSCDPRSDPAGNGCTAPGRRRATLALAVPGVGLLAGGIAMLVVGKRQQQRLAANLHADRRGFFVGATLRF